jgi:hypothetical protein
LSDNADHSSVIAIEGVVAQWRSGPKPPPI